MLGGELLCVLVLRAFQYVAAVAREDIESELRRKLMDGYDKTLAPFLFNLVDLRYGEAMMISLHRIQDLDEATSTLTIEAVVGMGWVDERLRFNRTEYNGTRYVGFPLSDVWTPRLWVLNHVQPEEQIGDTRALVFEGFVWVGMKYTLHTSCVPNLKYFPFDTQKCHIEMAAISQTGEMMELNFNLPSNFRRSYPRTVHVVENTRWKLINFSAQPKNKTLLDGQMVETELFSLEIQRTTPLIAMAVLTPAVLSVIVVLSGFWISPSSPARMGISMTGAYVSMSALFTLGKILPVTGVFTPIIVEYCATSLVLILLFSIHTCLISLAVRSISPFPFPYHVMLERMPTWALRLLGSGDVMPKETAMSQAFMYSELSEPDTAQENDISSARNNSAQNVESTVNPETGEFSRTSEPSSEWLKPMILLDKICFYIYIIIAVLYVVSIIIEE